MTKAINKELIEELEQSILLLNKRKKDILEKINTGGEYPNNYRAEIIQIDHQISILKEKIVLAKTPLASNQNIDIYYDENNSTDKEAKYLLTIHDCLEKIGYIEIRFENPHPFLGNIGYKIDRKFRGNGYTLQALNLLKPTMLENGLEHFTMTSYPDSNASIKIIQDFGGKLISEAHDNQYWNEYEVNLTEVETDQQEKKQK